MTDKDKYMAVGPQVTSTYVAARRKIGEFVSYIASEVTFSTLKFFLRTSSIKMTSRLGCP